MQKMYMCPQNKLLELIYKWGKVVEYKIKSPKSNCVSLPKQGMIQKRKKKIKEKIRFISYPKGKKKKLRDAFNKRSIRLAK